MTLRSSGIERARGLPGFTQYQSHVLHIRHIDTRLSIDYVTAKLLHGALELAKIRKRFVNVFFVRRIIQCRFLEGRYSREIFFQPYHFLLVEIFLAAQSNLLRVPGRPSCVPSRQ